ncbi:ABC transporter substrate-binding protein [bacterium]|nr:ABC transporter substrate-binding protein [bacterium]
MKFCNKLILTIAFLLLILSSLLSFSFAEASNYPLTIIDDTGSVVTIPEEPQRIISTAPSNTEILFSLGLENKIVGVTNYCNYPEKANNVEKIGEMTPLNLEKIASLKPDLILGYGLYQLGEIAPLKEAGYNIIIIEPMTINETLKSIRMVATICGITEKGNSLVESLTQRINKIKTKTSNIDISKRPKIFIGGIYETIWTPGEGTLFNELITLAGGRNIAASLPGWAKISPEFVAKEEPEIIIIPIGAMGQVDESNIKENISKHAGWSNIPAIKSGKIFVVNEDLFYRAGPRLIDGLEKLYEIFYE